MCIDSLNLSPKRDFEVVGFTGKIEDRETRSRNSSRMTLIAIFLVESQKVVRGKSYLLHKFVDSFVKFFGMVIVSSPGQNISDF